MTKQIIEADGFKWACENDDDHLALGGHEVDLGPVLEGFSDSRKSFLNIGAHVGSWAIRLSDKFYSVHAIEANYNTYWKLMENIELNKLSSRVYARCSAAWDSDDELVHMVDVNGMLTGGSTRVELGSGPSGVYTAKVDTMFSGYGRPTFGLITIDVEGAEARVLRGAKETINRDRPHMVVELHEGHPGVDEDIRQQVYDVLDELNYGYWSVDLTGERIICTPEMGVLENEASPASLHEESEDDIMLLRNLIGR